MPSFSLRSAMGWSLASYVAQFITTFAGSVITARLLTPVEMGIFGVGFAAYVVIAAVQNLGLTTYINQEKELTRERLGTVYSLVALQSVVLALIVFGSTPLISDFVNEPRIAPTMQILALFALANPASVTIIGVLQRAHLFRLIAINTLLRSAVQLVVTVWCALSGFSSTSMAWGALAGAVAAACHILFVGKHLYPFRWTLSEWRRVWAFGSRILMVASLRTVFSRATELVIGRAAGMAAVGFYGRANGIIDNVAAGFLTSFARVSVAAFVEARDNAGRIDQAYAKMTAISTGLFWPALAGIAVLADPLVRLVYGDRWIAAAPVLQLLAVAAIIDLGFSNYTAAYSVSGRVADLPRLELVRGMIGFLLLLVGVRFGLVGVAVGQVADALIFSFMLYPRMKQAFGISAGAMVRVYLRSAFVTAAACGPPLLIVTSRSTEQFPPILLFAAALAGGICWLGSLRLIRHELWPAHSIQLMMDRLASRS